MVGASLTSIATRATPENERDWEPSLPGGISRVLHVPINHIEYP